MDTKTGQEDGRNQKKGLIGGVSFANGEAFEYTDLMELLMLITLLGALAQSESESISANVRWGIRQAMREGRAKINHKHLYAYKKGTDGKPQIIPEQAEVVKGIYDRFLAGASLRQFKDWLESEGILNVAGETEWTTSAIRNILTNEKYRGDVLLQKTFIDNCISRRSMKNTGQLPMYLIENHHEGIVDRQTFDAVQAELARRKAGRSPTKAASNCMPIHKELSENFLHKLFCAVLWPVQRNWPLHFSARFTIM